MYLTLIKGERNITNVIGENSPDIEMLDENRGKLERPYHRIVPHIFESPIIT